MAHPYKTYTIEQLQEEEVTLKEKLRQAKLDNRPKHVAIYTRLIEIVRSFMLNPQDFQPGDRFEMIEEPEHLFEIDEISGVFAWGYRIDKIEDRKHAELEGVLLAMLGAKA